MRSLLALTICASLSCGHPRAAIIASTTAVVGIGVGLPAAHDCTPDDDTDCGLAHDLKYVAIGALAGAVLGLIAAYEYGRETPAALYGRRPVATRHSTERPIWAFSLDDAAPAAELPGSMLGARATGDSVAATCVAAKREVASMLDARCRSQGHARGLEDHTVLDERCTCTSDPDTGEVTCVTLANATCARDGGVAHALGFAAQATREAADAGAVEEAKLACEQRGGDAAAVVTRCACDGDDRPGASCGCVSDVDCALL